MSKKLKLYIRKDKGQIFKITGTKFPILVSLINEKWHDAVVRYNKLSIEKKTKGKVTEYLIDKHNFLKLAKEIGVSKNQIVVYYETTRQPVFSFGPLQLSEKQVTIKLDKDGKVVESKK